MKKLILSVTLIGFAASVFAQGTIDSRNNATGLRAPVYGPQSGNSTQSLTGNTSAGNPAGTQTYTGALLAGTSYLWQIFSASGSGAAEGSLVASSTAPTSFRTGTAAGFTPTLIVTLSNVAQDAAAATIQLRVWDNTSGLYNTWAAAETAWLAGTIAAGKSTVFNVANIGGTLNTPPLMNGLTSFNIYYQNVAPVPEPSTMALAALGGASLLLFRRRK